MKISILAIVTSILVVVDTATLNNENPTIWVRDTVRVLRSQTQNLYTSNLGLYQNIHIFDDGSHDCVSPVPAGHYWKYNTCPNGNKVDYLTFRNTSRL